MGRSLDQYPKARRIQKRMYLAHFGGNFAKFNTFTGVH
jgi:hypothetical protein